MPRARNCCSSCPTRQWPPPEGGPPATRLLRGTHTPPAHTYAHKLGAGLGAAIGPGSIRFCSSSGGRRAQGWLHRGLTAQAVAAKSSSSPTAATRDVHCATAPLSAAAAAEAGTSTIRPPGRTAPLPASALAIETTSSQECADTVVNPDARTASSVAATVASSAPRPSTTATTGSIAGPAPGPRGGGRAIPVCGSPAPVAGAPVAFCGAGRGLLCKCDALLQLLLPWGSGLAGRALCVLVDREPLPE